MRAIKIIGFILALLLSNLTSSFSQQAKIILSSRWFHPINSADPYSTVKAIKDFKVDQIDWMYNQDPDQLKQIRAAGIKYSLTLNPQIPDSLGFTTKKTRIIDRTGKPYIAPWMATWKSKALYWGCVNNPAFKELFLTSAKKIVDLGAYGIFVDDPRFNDHAVEWGGGCFCSFCLKKFSAFLTSRRNGAPKNFNYLTYLKQDQSLLEYFDQKNYKSLYSEFQRESVIEFIKDWKMALNAYSGKKIVFLTNNGGGNWTNIYSLFDVGIAEIVPEKYDFKKFDLTLATAKKLGKLQMFSFASKDQNSNISYYMYAYLHGSQSLLPWDLWMKNYPTRLFTPDATIIKVVNFLKSINLSTIKKLPLNTFTGTAESISSVSDLSGNNYIILLNHNSDSSIDISSFKNTYTPLLYGNQLRSDSIYGYVILRKKTKD